MTYGLSVLAIALLLLDVSPPVTKFEATYRNARTLRARFLESYSENGRLVRTEAGIAFFKKPGKMRWEYELPEKNLFLVDGKTAWFYTPVDHTATKIPARQSEDWRTPLALLAGEAKLSAVCARLVAAELPAREPAEFPAESGTGFECVLRNSSPKGSAEAGAEPAPRVFLEITRSGALARVLIESRGSVQTEFRFKEWEINPPLGEALFRFNPPPGVVIVDGLLPTAPGGRQ